MLKVHELRKTFHADSASARVALDGLSLALDEGDFAVVIGGNGAGKSTFLNAIAGEVTPDSGNISIAGEDVTAEPTHKRARMVARVFQDPLIGTAGPMTIEENLSLAERRGKRNGLRIGLVNADRNRYREIVARHGLGLESRLSQKVELLSGGQRQSLALSMAIIAPPKLLLLDEHCAALDPKTAEAVMRATVQAVERGRLTTLMVTHNMQHAIDYGNQLIMLMNGRIIFEARGEEKRGLTVEALVERFHLRSDRLLLI